MLIKWLDISGGVVLETRHTGYLLLVTVIVSNDNLVTVLYFLDDVTEDNELLEVIPGSDRGPAPNLSNQPRTLYIREYSTEDSLLFQANHIPSRYKREIVRSNDVM